MDLSPNQNSNADVEIADRGSWSTISGSSENNDGVPEAGQTLNNNAAVNAGPVAVQIEEETPPSYEQRKRPHNFQFEKKYPIRRFSRKWRRQEVQGFCCLAVEVICLTILAVLSLEAVGYFEDVKEEGHLPLTFSWKMLWEFFGNTLLPKRLQECLYSSKEGKVLVRGEDIYGNRMEPAGAIDYVLQDPYDPIDNEKKRKKIISAFELERSPDRSRCEFEQARYSVNWLIRFFMITNFMPVLNLISSTLLYTSIRIRRRKGMQVLLLLPSFFCFFVSIFQQIPTSFQYNYVDQTLLKDMHITLAQSNAPGYVISILDETQIHHQCCGIESPASWRLLPHYGFDLSKFPPSCCNYTAWDCSSLKEIEEKHVWSVGCYHVEQKKIHSYERLALFLYALKVVAEVGIFCTLSDLTRFEYPAPEVIETSRCDFRDYQITCRGVCHIKGITKDGSIVIKASYFLPWRLISSRVEIISGAQLQLKTDRNQLKGSVQVVKRQHAENFRNEDIQIDLSGRGKGIFVFTAV